MKKVYALIPLFSLPDSLKITLVSDMADEVFVRVSSYRSSSPCSQSSTPSSDIHSLYRRHPVIVPVWMTQ